MEVTDFDSAVSAAIAAVGDADDEAPATDAPLFDDQAEIEAPDQAEVSEAQGADVDAEASATEDLFADVEVELPAPEQELAPQTHIVPGVDKPVTTQELKDGFLRQADYTRKTQEIASQRKANEQAIRFWEALEADPMGVSRTLAEHAGLVAKGAAPQVQVELSPLRTAEQVEAEVNRRVAEVIDNHPVVVEARAAKAFAWVEGQFVHLEELAGQKLSNKDRSTILKTAAAKGITDLEVVFNALVAERSRKQAGTQSLRDVAPARATSRAVTQEVKTPADSFEEAAERAKAIIASKR
jgi:hypothetical protein